MTQKRMIDADALLAWVKIQIMSVHFVNYQSTIENNIYQKVIDKINEIATNEKSLLVNTLSANEPQNNKIIALQKAMAKDISDDLLDRGVAVVQELSDSERGGMFNTFFNGYMTAIRRWLTFIDQDFIQGGIYDDRI